LRNSRRPNFRRVNGQPVVYRTFDPNSRVEPTKTEIHMVVTTSFGVMDEDESGFIEPDETPYRTEGIVELPTYRRNAEGKFEPAEVRRISAAQARTEYIAQGDENGDGKWDFTEYRKWMTPHVVRNGISAEWRADIEGAY
jgi:hypothetical protein